jgi:GH24 family phage-related lysozyme (muramidase)
MTKKKTKTKLEVNAHELLEKDFARFKNETLEMIGEELPEFVSSMLEMAYKCGYQDGCIALGEQIAEAMGGDFSKSYSKN